MVAGALALVVAGAVAAGCDGAAGAGGLLLPVAAVLFTSLFCVLVVTVFCVAFLDRLFLIDTIPQMSATKNNTSNAPKINFIVLVIKRIIAGINFKIKFVCVIICV